MEILLKLYQNQRIRHVTGDALSKEFLLSSGCLCQFTTLQATRGSNEGSQWSLSASDKMGDEVIAGVSPIDEHNVKLLNDVHPRNWKNPEKREFPVVVLGAGAGGLISTIQGIALGMKVAIIEKALFGGDCLNIGCVPSKALLSCAKTVKQLQAAEEYGIGFQADSKSGDSQETVIKVKVDFAKVMERMRSLRSHISPVDSLERYSDMGASVFQGKARFLDKNTVEVSKVSESGESEQIKLQFSKAIIATGGRAFIPPIPGLTAVPYLTNETLFNLTTLPKSFAIIGGGPIGCEMAQAFALFGSSVYLFDREDRVLLRDDVEAAAIVQASLESAGVKLVLGSNIGQVRSAPGATESSPQLEILFSLDGKEDLLQVDQILIAAGRVPNVEELNLEAVGVQYTARGVTVDDHLQTTNANIYAVGDVCLSTQFTHMADVSAKVAFRNAMFPFSRETISSFIVPRCTYTSPELASVGRTEAELIQKDIPYSVLTMRLAHNDRAILEGGSATEGFVKLFIRKGADTILGGTIVASHAGDMISEVSVCIQHNIGAIGLSRVVHPYPTTADAIRLCANQANRARLTPMRKKMLRVLSSIKQRLF